jgi:hypothetical protein
MLEGIEEIETLDKQLNLALKGEMFYLKAVQEIIQIDK